MQLSHEQIADFNRDGFLLVKGVFRGEELSQLSTAADSVIDEALSGSDHDHVRKVVTDPSTYFRTQGLLDRDRAFAAAAVNPDLLRCIGQCLGRPFLLMSDSMLVKHAHNGVPVEWHQDPPYQGENSRSETFPIPNFVTDIYLDKSTEENGCIYALPGRHLCGHVAWPGLNENDLFDHRDSRPIVAEPGDVSFHSLSVPHGSRANPSTTKRRLLLYHYLSREVYEDAYAGWMKNKYGGYGAGNVDRLRRLRGLREEMGWPSDFSDIAFVDDGAEYVGATKQMSDAWAELRACISPTQLAHLRTVCK